MIMLILKALLLPNNLRKEREKKLNTKNKRIKKK